MFAVKGWNLDASLLKAQQEAPKTQKQQKKLPANQTPLGNRNEHRNAQANEQESKKRKRGDGPINVTEGNFVKLWEQVVEGKPKPTSEAKEGREKKKKKKKQADNGTLDGSEHEARDPDAQVEEIKDKPKRLKRQQKKQRENQIAKSDEQQQPRELIKGQQVADLPAPSVRPVATNSKLTPMQSAMRQKLVSARFRHLNQTLYTEASSKALAMFDQNPEMFADYHAGFRQQVDVWPENPVDNFIATIRARGAVKQPQHGHKGQRKGSQQIGDKAAGTGALQPLPRTHGTAVVADLGCGDARLASTLTSSNEISKLNLKLHSFDLASPSKFVTKADISSLPLADGSVDVAIFCLALMGTNWISFIEEAYRVLHWKGELWIAEIKSRFTRGKSVGRKVVEHSVGSKRKMKMMNSKAAERKRAEEDQVEHEKALREHVDGGDVDEGNGAQNGGGGETTDVSGFVEVLKRRGFVLKDAAPGNGEPVDFSNKMFVKMEFAKAATPIKGKGKTESGIKASQQQGGKKGRFSGNVDVDDEVATDDEGKMLKPCLYKIR